MHPQYMMNPGMDPRSFYGRPDDMLGHAYPVVPMQNMHHGYHPMHFDMSPSHQYAQHYPYYSHYQQKETGKTMSWQKKQSHSGAKNGNGSTTKKEQVQTQANQSQKEVTQEHQNQANKQGHQNEIK